LILRTAFGVEDDYIQGAPSWVHTNRYDVEAKVAPEDAPMTAPPGIWAVVAWRTTLYTGKKMD
jgi:uncharacterized protein (TIGR03435 family)